MTRLEHIIKRLIDLTIALIGLILIGPVLVLAALLIVLTSHGPAFYYQDRLGKDGVPFSMLKLRTMYRDAPDKRNPDGSVYAGQDDPRVTPIGRVLRKTSLDELPQLINVIKGDMSLIGPRPDLVDQARFYTEAERQKLAVKPGLTGLAQISGRNAISWEDRKLLDLEYVRRQSLALDLQILLKTIPYVLAGIDITTEDGPTS